MIDLLDDAATLVGGLDEPATTTRSAAGLDDARAGPGPGAYGSGVYQAIEGRAWRSRADLRGGLPGLVRPRAMAVWPAWSHLTRFVGGSPPSRWP